MSIVPLVRNRACQLAIWIRSPVLISTAAEARVEAAGVVAAAAAVDVARKALLNELTRPLKLYRYTGYPSSNMANLGFSVPGGLLPLWPDSGKNGSDA